MVEWKKLKDICNDIIVPMRDRPKIFDGTIPWCRIEDIEGMYFNRSLSDLMVSETVIKDMNLKVFPTGSVICSCSATLGVCAINTQPLITNQTFIGLVCSEQINNRFLYYYMTTRKKELLSLSTTGTIPYVSRDKFERMNIPVPSISGQQRIVEKLDTFTSSIENLKEQIAQRRKQYEYYRDQLLDLEGKEGVEMKTLGDICSKITDGAHFSPQAIEEGYYMPSVKDMRSNGFDFSSCKQISKSDYENLVKNGCKPRLNDVLIAKDGSMLKYVFPVVEEKDIVVLSSIAILTPKHEIINSQYLSYYLIQDKIKEKTIREFSSKGGVPRIILNNFKKINIAYPSLSEQQHIVSILDTFEASISNLEAQLKEREKQYEYYRNQLLTFE